MFDFAIRLSVVSRHSSTDSQGGQQCQLVGSLHSHIAFETSSVSQSFLAVGALLAAPGADAWR
jgi:hypothetical protein